MPNGVLDTGAKSAIMKAGIYRTMSCSNVRIEQRYCRSDGDSDCGSIIAWD